MSPEERNTGHDSGESHDNGLMDSIPALAAARRLVRVSLSRLHTAIPPLARYTRSQLNRLRLPDTSLSRWVTERTRPLLATIIGRSATQPSDWAQPPNLVWWGHPQTDIGAAWPSIQMGWGGEVSPDTIPQTPASKSGYQPLSLPDSYPFSPATTTGEPRTSYPAPTDRTVPGRTSSEPQNISRKRAETLASTSRHETKDSTRAPTPAEPKTQAAPPKRQTIRTVRSSVEEPAASARPIIKSASEEPVSRQPEATRQPEPAEPESPPQSFKEKLSSVDTTPESVPTPVPEIMATSPSLEPSSSTAAVSDTDIPETTPLAASEPLAPASKPAAPTVEPVARPATGILNRLKSAWPELGRNIIRKAEKSLSATRVIQSRLADKISPAASFPTVTQPALVRSGEPAESAVSVVPGAATTPAFPPDITPVQSVSPGSYEYYVNINQTYQPARPEMPLSPASLRSAIGVTPPSLPTTDASDTGLFTEEEYITEPPGKGPLPGLTLRESAPAGSYYGYSQETPAPRSIRAAYAPRPGQISRKPAAEDFYPATPSPATDIISDTFVSARREPVNTTTPEPLPSLIQARPDYGGQPVPELSLAPAERPSQTETQAALPTRTGTEAPEETGPEASPPDIDAFARDVYRILKRRLARERERSLGLS